MALLDPIVSVPDATAEAGQSAQGAGPVSSEDQEAIKKVLLSLPPVQFVLAGSPPGVVFKPEQLSQPPYSVIPAAQDVLFSVGLVVVGGKKSVALVNPVYLDQKDREKLADGKIPEDAVPVSKVEKQAQKLLENPALKATPEELIAKANVPAEVKAKLLLQLQQQQQAGGAPTGQDQGLLAAATSGIPVTAGGQAAPAALAAAPAAAVPVRPLPGRALAARTALLRPKAPADSPVPTGGRLINLMVGPIR
jgi:hypothetical protein